MRRALDPRGLPYVGILCLLGVLFFGGTFDQPFSYDDLAYLDKARATVEDPAAFYRQASIADSRYIAHLYFLATWQLFGEDPVGYHVANVLLHLLNAWLTAGLFLRLQGRPLLAGLAGLICLTSTVAFEAIYWISAAPILIAAACAMGSALACIHQFRTARRLFGGVSLLAFLCAFLSYEPAGVLVVPLAFLAWRESGRDRWPLAFIGAAVVALLAVVALDQAASANLRAREPNYTAGPHVLYNVGFLLGRWALNQFTSPTGWDSIEPADVARGAFGAYAAVGGLVAVLLLWLTWHRAEVSFAALWTLAAVLPFAPWDNQSYFPRYWYLAQIGGAYVLSWLVVGACGRIRARRVRWGVAAAFGLIAVSMAYAKTVEYTARYKLKAAIYTANYGDPWAAIRLYKELLSELPDEALSLKYNLGVSYFNMGDPRSAEPWLREALAEDPRHLQTLLLHARVLLDLERFDEGLAALDRAASVGPEGRRTVQDIVSILAAAGNRELAAKLSAAMAETSADTP